MDNRNANKVHPGAGGSGVDGGDSGDQAGDMSHSPPCDGGGSSLEIMQEGEGQLDSELAPPFTGRKHSQIYIKGRGTVWKSCYFAICRLTLGPSLTCIQIL